MKIIVTGGAGFIGSHLVEALSRKGHQVMILDDFSTGLRKFIPPQAQAARVSTHDYKKLEPIFKSFCPEAVFHLAAQIDIRSTFEDRKRYATDSMNILRLSQICGVKNLVFSSSAAVYGANEKLPWQEKHDIRPSSAYGHSKANFEIPLSSQHRGDKIKVVALRYANVYGPRQGVMGEGGVVAIFCKRLLAGAPLNIFGSGRQTRDFVFVDDVVAANLSALKSKNKIAVYNVSTNKETSVNSLAKTLLSVSGCRGKVKHSKMILKEVRRSALSNRLIRKELGWSPRVGLPEGLKITWEWFKENYKL